MYVRLAFAVAAHLEPEILIVDEVLAVGDVAFQQKCLGKMGTVAREGRTVLFVSHNMAAIQSLCDRCILLNNGHIESDNTTDIVIQKYVAMFKTCCLSPLKDRTDRRGNGKLRFSNVYLKMLRKIVVLLLCLDKNYRLFVVSK